MNSASPDLVSIAQSQIALLTQSLGAASSVVYLAEGIAQGMPTDLVEVAAYPVGASEELPADSAPMLPASASSALVKPGRVVLPLVYEGEIVGVLMAGREDRNWTETEHFQIQQIANTLAIACALDRRCQWLEESQKQTYLGQQQFLSTVMHQLRNPLTAIKTFAKLLARRIAPDNPMHRFVSGILQESQHMQDILAEVDQARYAAEELALPQQEMFLLPASTLELAATDLAEILTPLLRSTEAIAETKGLSFRAYMPAELPPIKANGGALREVLGNLLDNAVKYTPQGQVEIAVRVLPETVAIAIKDSGYGIPSKDLEHLFDRRFRGRQAHSNIPGSGIGLAIVKELLSKMQGEIKVNSQENQGSIFTVILKRWPQAEISASR